MMFRVNKKFFQLSAYWNKLKLLTLKQLFRLKVPIKTQTTVRGYEVTFLTSSYLEYFLRAKEGFNREPITVNWILDIIRPGEVVYDIGANVGTYSLLMGKRVMSGGGKVYALEPAAVNFLSLTRNIFANQLNGVVIPIPLACDNESRLSILTLSSEISGSALHYLNLNNAESGPSGSNLQQGVFSTSLDRLTKEYDVLFPNHIKIDTDGGEMGIVEGMKVVLGESRLRSVMIEIDFDVSQGIIEEEFRKAGFEEKGRQLWTDGNNANVLYVRVKGAREERI